MKKIAFLLLFITILIKGYSQWEQIDFPNGIGINNLYNDGNLLFASTTNGVYKYNPPSWEKLSEDINLNISSVFNFNNYLFAGSTTEGVYRSSDNGISWLQTNNSLTTMNIRVIGNYNENIVVGTTNGIFFSENNGLQWLNQTSNLSNTYINAILEFNDSIFVGTQNGIFMSSDTAQNWVNKSNGLSNNNITSMIAIDSLLFSSTWSGGVFLSIDSANNWTSQNNNLNNLNINTIYFHNDTLFAGTNDSLYFASDLENISWQAKAIEQETEEITTINSYNNSLVIGNSFGTYSKSDSDTLFTQINNGFPDWLITDIFHSDSSFYAQSNSGIWKFDSDSTLWSLEKKFPQNNISDITIYRDSIYLLINSTGLYASYDTTKNWEEIHLNTYLTSIAIWDSIILMGTSNQGVLRSNDFGENWLPVNIGLSSTYINRIICNDDYFYAVVSDNEIYRSSNFGDEWSEIVINDATGGGPLNDILSLSNQVFAAFQIHHSFPGTENKIFCIKNEDPSFSVNDSSFINYRNNHNSLMSLTSIDTILIAGSEYAGVFMSNDKGANWYQINKGLEYDYNYYYQNERSYCTINKIISIDSTMYFVNDSNRIFHRNLSNVLPVYAPQNLRASIDTLDYDLFDFTFRWDIPDVSNISEYVLLKRNKVKSYNDTPRDTIHNFSVINDFDTEITYRLVASDNGDFSNFSDNAYYSNITELVMSNFIVYPNPTNDYLILDLSKYPSDTEFILSIYNIVGEEILKVNTGNFTRIDFAEYNSGIYIIQLKEKGTNSVFSKKIIKH